MSDMEWRLVDRFKEPSSWAGLAAVFSTIGVSLSPGIMQAVSLLGAGACVLLGVLLKEGAK